VRVTYTGREKDEKGRIWCEGYDEMIKIPNDEEFEGKGLNPEYDHPRGFYLCLRNTQKGERNYFKLKATDKSTFGSVGSDIYGIQPNTDLFYDIFIADVEKFKLHSWQLGDHEKISKAVELKGIANDFFRRKKLLVANKVYDEILRNLKSISDEDKKNNVINEQVNMIYLAVFSNKALVEIALDDLLKALGYIEKGLAINPKHEKLRYRQALVYFKLGDFTISSKILANLQEDFPENKVVKLLVVKNARASKISIKKTKELAKRMFSTNSVEKPRKLEGDASAKVLVKEKGNVENIEDGISIEMDDVI